MSAEDGHRHAGNRPDDRRPGWHDGPAIRLTRLGPDHFLSATGEVLDLTGPTPSYANIPLTRA